MRSCCCSLLLAIGGMLLSISLVLSQSIDCQWTLPTSAVTNGCFTTDSGGSITDEISSSRSYCLPVNFQSKRILSVSIELAFNCKSPPIIVSNPTPAIDWYSPQGDIIFEVNPGIQQYYGESSLQFKDFSAPIAGVALRSSSYASMYCSVTELIYCTTASPIPQLSTTLTPSSGWIGGGDFVTISGTGISEVDHVIIAGTTVMPTSFTSTSIVLMTPPATAGVVPTITVALSNLRDDQVTLTNAFTYFDNSVLSATPSEGLCRGGYQISIYGQAMIGSAESVTEIVVGTCQNATIIYQSPSLIVVDIPIGQYASGAATITVKTESRISTSIAAALFTFAAPRIAGATPSVGLAIGGYPVTIFGSFLGDGSDISRVTFDDEAVIVQSQTTNSVVVSAPPGTAGDQISFSITSDSQGVSVFPGGFSYGKPLISSVTPVALYATPSSGTLVTLSGSLLAADDATSVTIGEEVLAILSQSSSTGQIVGRFSQISKPFAGPQTVCSVSPTQGTACKAAAITVLTPAFSAAVIVRCFNPTLTTLTGTNLGDAGAITSVTLAGISVPIQEQQKDSVTVLTPYFARSVTGSIQIVSSEQGSLTSSSGSAAFECITFTIGEVAGFAVGGAVLACSILIVMLCLRKHRRGCFRASDDEASSLLSVNSS